MKAIILAGGEGTRLRPLTNETPKPLLHIKGKPIIEHAIDNFRKHGIKNIILSIGYKADKIKKYFGDGSNLGVEISYSVESEPLGTGGAIKLASRGIDEPFVVINGDNLGDFDWTSILKSHQEKGAKITLALCPVEDVTKFGIARLEGDKLIEFIEKPSVEKAPSNLNNAGAYVFEPSALNILPEGKSSIERDCFEKLSKTGVVYAFNHTGQWFPTDDIERYNFAERNFNPLLKIKIGSLNMAKIEAVKEIIREYNFLSNAEIEGVEIQSGVSDQPKSMEETVKGAINRAKQSFSNCNLSFGIESGLMKVPETKSGFMDFCVCAIYDGIGVCLGLSSAWEAPKKISELMHNEGLDMSQAVFRLGMSDNPNIGAKEGLIGIVTKNRLTRKEYTKQALRTALIHLENKELY